MTYDESSVAVSPAVLRDITLNSGLSKTPLEASELYYLQEKDVGLFWEYTPAAKTMHILHSFPVLKSEGLAFNTGTEEFCIVFDTGSRYPSQFLTVKVPK